MRDYELAQGWGRGSRTWIIVQTQVELARALIEADEDWTWSVCWCGRRRHGVVLQVNVREGEYVGYRRRRSRWWCWATPTSASTSAWTSTSTTSRVSRRTLRPGRTSPRYAGDLQSARSIARVEPYVIPKKSLTGDNTERVDTGVLQVIYELDFTSKKQSTSASNSTCSSTWVTRRNRTGSEEVGWCRPSLTRKRSVERHTSGAIRA